MNPTRLYLIRHGETNLSAEDRFSGGTDVDLSEEGRWQINCLARRLADDKITAFYCSPMRRTIETASIIAKSFNLTPQMREGLREIHHGRWETRSRAEVESCTRKSMHPGSRILLLLLRREENQA